MDFKIVDKRKALIINEEDKILVIQFMSLCITQKVIGIFLFKKLNQFSF